MDLFRDKIARAQGGLGQARIGIVSSTDWRNGAAKVVLQPEGVMTGWLPVVTPWAGAGWGMQCPPDVGDQVLVIPQEGNVGCGLIAGCLYSNAVRPPAGRPGEFVIRHSSGTTLALRDAGTVTIEGDLHVSGEVRDGRGTLGSLRDHFNSHIHAASNGQVTSPPLNLD